MPMRIVLLGEPGGWHIERLRAAVVRRGHLATVVRWQHLTASVGDEGLRFGPAEVSAADAIVVRGMPGAGTGTDRLESVVFRMDVLGCLETEGMPVVNRPRALEIAIDKYLSLAALARAGLRVPRTVVVQDAEAARAAFAALGSSCVAKPIFGSRGRGIALVSTATAAAAAVSAGGLGYLQEFLPHAGWDVRVLVIGDQTFAMRRIAAAGEWRTNISLGGRPEAFAPPTGWLELARRAAAAVGATVAGVDILPTDDGPVVLEVNAVPGWQGLQAVTEIDLADEIAALVERTARQTSDTGL
jgi:ribosomal protein S6--L-glutamate ligase